MNLKPIAVPFQRHIKATVKINEEVNDLRHNGVNAVKRVESICTTIDTPETLF